MKNYLISLTFLLSFGAPLSLHAGETEQTPDELDITGADQLPADIPSLSPLSELDQNLVASAYAGRLAEVEVHVKKGANVNLQDQKKRTPLIFAASAGHTAVVEYLIEAGADVSMQDSDGQTALLHASKRSFNDTATVLLDNGADVNVQSKKRNVTALMMAAVWDNTELVKILLDHGADPHMTDSFGRTAKLLAQKKGNTAVLAMLPDAPEPPGSPGAN